MSDAGRTGMGIEIRVSDAIPDGEVWLASGCGWRADRPEVPHGEPEWRVAGMCLHEHLEKMLLCAGCKGTLEVWPQRLADPPGPWCPSCFWMSPGGHSCTMAVEFRPLG